MFSSIVDRPVGTYLFYWYDKTTHPNFIYQPEFPIDNYLWTDKNWWRYVLGLMLDCGINIVFPAYYGTIRPEAWYSQGLNILNEVLLEGNYDKLKIGMFFCPPKSAIKKIDFSTIDGAEWFLNCINNFYSRINAEYQVLIDGKLPIVLFDSVDISQFYENLFVDIRGKIKNVLGKDVVFIGDVGWKKIPNSIDWTNSWGSALNGVQDKDVINVGPGFKDANGRYRDRENGKFFIENFNKAIDCDPYMIIIETYNEKIEGSEIDPTADWGKQYIDLTKTLIKQFQFPYRFVKKCYKELYNQEPEQTNFELYVQEIKSGKLKPSDIIKLFFDSEKYIEYFQD